MRRLLPEPAGPVDAYDAYRPEHAQPLLRLNMVLSADGRATDRAGRSGGLSGEADQAVFRALRALADAILVGAGTVRAEGYGPHRLRPELRERRVSDGRPTAAPIVVVSRSLDLDFAAPLFTEAEAPTMVLTCEAAPDERRQVATRAGVVVVAGEREVDLALGLSLLRERFGLPHVLCEGGPTLNGPLFDGGLVDELCLTLSPTVVGSGGPHLLRDSGHGASLRLLQVLEDDDELFLHYRVG